MEPAVRSRNIVETQDFCYNGSRILDNEEKGGKPMHISYQPLWNTLKERGMRKEDLRLAAGLTTNMIAQYENATAYLRGPELWYFGCD